MDSSYSIILAPANNSTNFCTSALHNRRKRYDIINLHSFFFFVINVVWTDYIGSLDIAS